MCHPFDDRPALIGIEIGGTKTQVVVGAPNGGILDRRRFLVDRAAGAKGILSDIASAVDGFFAATKIEAIGIAFGGPVDRLSGTTLRSHQIDGWDDFCLADWAERRWKIPVSLENDANTAAFAESRFGAGVGSSSTFYTTLGSGVGGGMVIGDAIFHGALASETEIGHLTLPQSGQTVESLCSGWAVNKRLRTSASEQPNSWLARNINQFPGAEARILGNPSAREDSNCQAVIAEVSQTLAWAFSVVSALLSPARIVIGGGLSHLGDWFRDEIDGRLQGLLMDALRPGPQLRLAKLGEDVVPIGALALAQVALESRSRQES